MPKGVKNDFSIELACTLCPKNPKFSDISHLLTHISSKSHLSYRFKLQIRAASEPEAKDKLDNFDYWYHENNIDTMLSERLAAKEQKKSAKERKAKLSNASTKRVKNEVRNEGRPAEETLATTPVFRAPVPRMHLWPTAGPSHSMLNEDWEDENTIYSTPTMRRSVPNFALAETIPVGTMRDPRPVTPWKPGGLGGVDSPDNEKEKTDGKLSDSNKLKGVLWPGMDLFDSATPEMKRMRNQRKNRSVLDQMIATSTGVEPTEMVYLPDGQIHHSRDIFGPLSPLSTDISPNNKVVESVPKKRRLRKAAILSDINVNVPRLKAPRAKKNAISRTPMKRSSAARPWSRGPPPPPFIQAPTLNPLALARFGQSYIPTSEEDEEFRKTVGDMTKKRPFGIFQDAPEVSPGRTESSLEDLRFDFSGERLTGRPADKKSSDYLSPTPAGRQPGTSSTLDASRGFGKENGKSFMPPHVHVRQTISTSSSHTFPAQYLYDPVINPLYDPTFARTFPYGGHHNEFNQDSKPPPPRFHSTFHGEFRSIHPPQSPSDQRGHGARPSIGVGRGVRYGV